jgi:hypothetical protein
VLIGAVEAFSFLGNREMSLRMADLEDPQQQYESTALPVSPGGIVLEDNIVHNSSAEVSQNHSSNQNEEKLHFSVESSRNHQEINTNTNSTNNITTDSTINDNNNNNVTTNTSGNKSGNNVLSHEANKNPELLMSGGEEKNSAEAASNSAIERSTTETISVNDSRLNNPVVKANPNKHCQTSVSSPVSLVTVDNQSQEIQAVNQPPPQTMQKLWQYWPGNNRFYFNGRIMSGPNPKAYVITFLIILVPAVLFLAFPAADLYDRYPGRFVVIVGAILTVLTLVSLSNTALTDPGIILRNTNPIASTQLDNPFAIRPRTQEHVVNGKATQLKYCETCQIYRPPRTVHCGICNNCVEVFDHHCECRNTIINVCQPSHICFVVVHLWINANEELNILPCSY